MSGRMADVPLPSRVPTYIENIAFGVNFSPGPFFMLIVANLASFCPRERYVSELFGSPRVTSYLSATTKNNDNIHRSLAASGARGYNLPKIPVSPAQATSRRPKCYRMLGKRRLRHPKD